MEMTTFEWRTRDGRRVYAAEWRPGGGKAARGVVGIVHGFGEHSGSYRHVADFYVREGFAILAFDQLGHGRSDGRRGDSRTYDELLDNVGLLVGEMRERYPEKPHFLYGHSMGGNLTLNFLLRRRPVLTGAVVASPWLRLALTVRQVAARLGISARMLLNRRLDVNPLEASFATSDAAMLERMERDPFRHKKITARFFRHMHRAGRWALDHAGGLEVPLLLMHGGNDRLTSRAASREFAQRAGEWCDYMEWPGFKHELHTELGRNNVLAYALDWMNGRLCR